MKPLPSTVHFQIVDVYRIDDPVGLDCQSEEQAKTIVQDIAKQIAIGVFRRFEKP
jgi:hypothetical protein